MNSKFLQKGIGITEGIVGIALLLIIFLSMSSLLTYYQKINQQNEQKLEAANIAAEAIEAIYSVKNEDWNNISALNIGTNYYPQILGNKWILASTNPGPVALIYNRWVIFERVYRNANDNISLSGVEDADTRKVTAYIQWSDRGTSRQVSLVSYITNW